jgi:hypothetical protein
MIKLTPIAVAFVLCAAGALGQNHARSAGQTVIRIAPRQSVGHPFDRRSLIGLSGTRRGEDARRRRFASDSFFSGGWPYFPPEYDAYGPEPVMQAPQPAQAPQAAKPEPALEPALYELRENHWVRLNFGEASASSSAQPSQAFVPPVAKELPPAILIYRDGHTEELSSYSIIGVTIYTKADYWTSGAWTRKIQIAELDLPATLKQNHERGLAFQLPSGPDEVILRP